MSVVLMTLAWKSDFQSGKKMVLLALCDNANDQGECFPSISMLASKCSMSERSVFNHVASLEANGAIRRENRPGRSTVYHLDPCKFCSTTPATAAPQPLQILHPTPADSSPQPLKDLQDTPAMVASTPATAAPITIKEPSTNHQQKSKEKPRAFDAGLIDLPDWLDRDVWQRWARDRKKRGKSITEDAARLQVKKLADHLAAGYSPESVIDNAIENGWQGLYEPKNKPRTAGKHTGFQNFNYREGVTADGTLI